MSHSACDFLGVLNVKFSLHISLCICEYKINLMAMPTPTMEFLASGTFLCRECYINVAYIISEFQKPFT
jgi:hypothetical protein